MIRQAVEQADALVVPTRAVAEHLIREFPHAGEEAVSRGLSLSERIHVAGGAASLESVPEGEARETRAAFGLATGRRYVVFLGTIEPRKGLELLVRAVASRKDLDLVIVGAPGWGKVDIRHVAMDARLDPDRLVVTGAVHDSSVASIVQGASALVLPSLAEGFGLPLIEAMQLGTPVVLSDDDALVEVAGGAGVVANVLQFDRVNVAGAVRELNRALDESFDRAAALIEAGHRRCADFSWDTTAARVANIHRQFAVHSSE
jgi:glycosyltransferase involved in cell wall biosynthesis